MDKCVKLFISSARWKRQMRPLFKTVTEKKLKYFGRERLILFWSIHCVNSLKHVQSHSVPTEHKPTVSVTVWNYMDSCVHNAIILNAHPINLICKPPLQANTMSKQVPFPSLSVSKTNIHPQRSQNTWQKRCAQYPITLWQCAQYSIILWQWCLLLH